MLVSCCWAWQLGHHYGADVRLSSWPNNAGDDNDDGGFFISSSQTYVRSQLTEEPLYGRNSGEQNPELSLQRSQPSMAAALTQPYTSGPGGSQHTAFDASLAEASAYGLTASQLAQSAYRFHLEGHGSNQPGEPTPNAALPAAGSTAVAAATTAMPPEEAETQGTQELAQLLSAPVTLHGPAPAVTPEAGPGGPSLGPGAQGGVSRSTAGSDDTTTPPVQTGAASGSGFYSIFDPKRPKRVSRWACALSFRSPSRTKPAAQPWAI
jgi:hypothetical protein